MKKCSVCGTVGHNRLVCPVRCSECGSPKHIGRECPKQKRFNQKFGRLFKDGKRKRRRWKKKWEKRKQRTRRKIWRSETSCAKWVRFRTEAWKLFTRIFREEDYLLESIDLTADDRALMARSGSTCFGDSSTFLGDTGASTHMVGTDEGMFDCREIHEQVVVGDGKPLRATKIGKLRRTVHQLDGKTQDIVLEDVKLVPGLDTPLFGILKALAQGWRITNKGIHLALKKNGVTIVFDRLLETKNGVLVGVALLPRTGDKSKGEMAMATRGVSSTKSWDINRMHRVYNHAGEEALRKTAKAYGWTVTGKLGPCEHCQISNQRSKGVAKSTDVKSDKPGERVFIDSTSIQTRSFGGNRFLLGVVDDCTDFTWCKPLKRKCDQTPVMMKFLRLMKSRGTPVKYIRCDNAGENKDLKRKCEESKDLNDIKFEFTPRDSPQYNGKVERKFAVMFARVRVNFAAAKIAGKLRNKLWAEACCHAIDVENLLVSASHIEPSLREFFKKDIIDASQMKQFGEVGVIKTTKRIKGKLKDRGIPVIYLGRAKDHSSDTYRFLNLGTELVLISRDVIWLDQVYGDYKGDRRETVWDVIGINPKMKDPLPTPEQPPDEPRDEEEEPARQVQPEPTREATEGVRTRSRGMTETPSVVTGVRRYARDLKALGVTVNEENVEESKADGSEESNEEPDRVASAIAFALVDRFGEDIGDLAPDFAMRVQEVDPAKFKDMYDNPKSFDEAWNHPDAFQREKWREAIKKEFDKMEHNGVWKKVKRNEIPEGRRCVKYKWVFEIKRSGVFRARLVACGYSQVPGVDFNEVFSPVCNDVTFRMVIVLMIIWRLEALIFDVTTAFLTGDLEEEIYMECPDGMEHDDDEVLLLLKTIYGLVQASRQYNKKFTDVLVNKMGFRQCRADRCLYYRRNKDGLVIVLTYVDDNLCVGHPKALKAMLEEIPKHGLQITVEHELKDYLSCEIRLNEDRTKAWIGQPHMIKKIEKTFGEEVNKRQRYKTAGTPGLGLVKVKEEEGKIDKERQSRYRTGVGMLLYLIKHSRPDICNAVRELSKCLDGASEASYKEMLRVIKYVLDTKLKGLKVEPELVETEWIILLFSDSDWAGDKDNRRSVGGYMIFLNGVLICWRSKLQKVVSLSSAEAEFYACSEAVKEIPFIIQILEFVGAKVKKPVEVMVDNVGAIYMSQNQVGSSRTRHMDTRYYYVNDLQEDGMIKVMFVRSEDNVADVATKNVTGEIQDRHIDRITGDRDYWMEDHGGD